jgi:hypothetical protein
MTNRDFVLKAVKRMPANASFQKIILDLDELLLAESIKRVLAKPRGKGVPIEEVPKLIEGWVRDAKRKKRVRK